MPDNSDHFKFLCFGMGAIGTYIGGSLAASGNEVVFLEKAAVGKDDAGFLLHVRRSTGDLNIPEVQICQNLEEALGAGDVDVLLVAVKAFDTPEVVDSLKRHGGRIPTILCLQNGVENEPLIELALGPGSVIGASITTAVRRIGLGDVQLEKLRGIAIEAISPFGVKLVQIFNQAGLKAKGYPNRAEMKWSKLLTNLQVNATSAILNWTPAQILKNPLTYRIEVMQLREALAVMHKMGLGIVDLPGTPVRMLMSALTSLPLSVGRVLVGTPLSKARGGKMPSLQIDLQAGRARSEVEYLNGAVVRAGEKYGVHTPVNRVLTDVLVGLAAGTVDREEYFGRPENLMKSIEAAI